jgi:site-specific DNA recombinase
MSGPVRVAVYTRISTDETNQPYSLGAQSDRLDAFVTSQPDWRIVARYTDQASGKGLDRPALATARQAAATGAFDLLLVYRVDRLSRNLGQLVGLIEELAAHNVGFRSATEPFDTALPVGRMLVQLLGSFAEFERAIIMDRISAGMERKAARGEWTGGNPPFGYLKPKGTSTLLPDPATGPIVVAIFRRYVDTRDGARTIAAWLHAAGHRTRTGRAWSTTSVLAILRNRAYIGEVSFRGVWRAGAQEPLVDRDLFDAAQAILEDRAASPRLRRTNPTDFLLSSLSMRCERCGHPMVGASARGRGGRRYAYYTCSSRARRGLAACDQPRLPQGELEDAILAQMTEVYGDTDLVAMALDAAAAQSQTAAAEAQQTRLGLRTEATNVGCKIERYVMAFESGALAPEAFGDRVTALQLQLAVLEARLQEGTPPTSKSEGPVDAAIVSWALSQALGAVLRGAPAATTKALLRVLINEIRVSSPEDIQASYRVPMSVRTLNELVAEGGFEPPTKGL